MDVRLAAVAAVAVAALGGSALQAGLAQEGASLPQDRFDADGLESRLRAAVGEAVRLYVSEGGGALDSITASEAGRIGHPVFVLNATTGEVVAYSGRPHLVGAVHDGIFAADRPYGEIVSEMAVSGGAWAAYMSVNPDTRTRQLERAWLFQHDGYVFGSGYFAPDARVQQMVDGALLLYGERGEEAFGMITPRTPPGTVALHPFVLNATTAEAMAGGAYPQLLGAISDALLNGADRPYGEIQDDLNRDGATWASYMLTNPHTRTEQLMRTWLHLHDGLIFASGYYLPDSRARSLTDGIVSIYDRDRVGALERVRALAEDPRPIFIFVVNPVTQTVLVDSSGVLDFDAHWTSYIPLDRPIVALLLDITRHGSIWGNMVLTNPDTGTEQVRRSLATMHGDLSVFVTGYFIPDSEAQSVVDHSILLYESEGMAAFDRITPDEPAATDATYPFVVNATTWRTVAHGADPDLVDTCCSDAIRHASDRSFGAIQEDLDRDGGTWVEYDSRNPDTGTIQTKRSWLFQHDGYVFGSGYYLLDSQVQAIVHHRVLSYMMDGDVKALEAPLEADGSFYHFVIDAGTLEVVGRGAGGDAAGLDQLSVTGADRPAEEILADLEGERGTWSEYTTTNPGTGAEELKRSWLSLHDGYIFGAGYYASDAAR